MSLSVTGNLLTGPFLRPDITFATTCSSYTSKNVPGSAHIDIVKKPGDEAGTTRFEVEHRPGKEHTVFTATFEGGRIYPLNILGWIPGVSTFTGAFRTLAGLVHAIVHLAQAVFDKEHDSQHLQEAALGGYNILRGVTEMAPVVGNLIVAVYDHRRLQQAEQEHMRTVLLQLDQRSRAAEAAG